MRTRRLAVLAAAGLLHGCSVLMMTPPPPEAYWDVGPVVGCSGPGWVILDGVYAAGHLATGSINLATAESDGQATAGKFGLALGTVLLASAVFGGYRASRCSAYMAHRNGGSLDCTTDSDCSQGWRCDVGACEPYLLPDVPEGE